MRTTITITPDLLKKTMRVSGRARYSEAIVTSLKDYIAMKERLELLDLMLDHKSPHNWSKIKRARRKHQWLS